MVFILIVIWAGCGEKESSESSVETSPILVLAENPTPLPRNGPKEEARNSVVSSTTEVKWEKIDAK